jgi:hypothetical protein
MRNKIEIERENEKKRDKERDTESIKIQRFWDLLLM